MDRISINEVSTFRWNFLEDVARYATLGFGGIGVWRHKISDFCDHTVSEVIRAARFKVSSVQWAGGFTGSAGLSFAEAFDDAVGAIRTASILHADCLIVHPGALHGHTRSHAQRLLTSALDGLVPIARDFGVRLALEPMPANHGGDFTFVDSLSAAVHFLGRYPAEAVGLVLDLFHQGLHFAEANDWARQVQRVALVQVADRRTGPIGPSKRLLPGCGEIDLTHWIGLLERSGYAGFYEFEMVGEDSASLDPFELLEELRGPGLKLVHAGRNLSRPTALVPAAFTATRRD
jgi:sugar phosphate isomerase/epimerase